MLDEPPFCWTGFAAERWKLRGEIGRGTQGWVMLAEDQLIGRQVAIKVFRSPEYLPWARREVAALLALDLPCVVRLEDHGVTEQNLPFLVLEHLAGELFPGVGRNSWASVMGPWIALLRALRLVHAAAVVHRDLRPEHVRIVGDRVVLLDFGVGAGSGATSGPERAGVGNLHTMAPEQVEAPDRIDGRTDLYAAGVMLYDALQGAPYPDIDAVLRGERPRLDRPDLPEAIADLLARLLDPEIDARPGSASEVLAALGRRDDLDVLSTFRHWGALDPEVDLEPVFAGPRRIFRWPERMAALLRRRAGPRPESWAAELSAWVRAGRARNEDGVRVTVADAAWLDEGAPLRLRDDGTLGAEASIESPRRPILSAVRQRVAEGDLVGAISLARDVAGACFAEGDAPGAMTASLLGLHLTPGGDTGEGPLLVELACAGLAAGDAGSLRVARHQLARRAPSGSIAQLLDAAQVARAGDSDAANHRLRDLPPFDDERLDRWRLGLRIEASQRSAGAEPERALADARRWAERRATPTALADFHGWQGMLAVARGDFEAAAADLAKAGPGKASRSGRLSTQVNEAVARMELRRFEAATVTARAVLREAEGPFPTIAAMAEWVLRSVRYREGHRDPPDLELVGAARELGSDSRRAQIATTEAAFAWRSGDAATMARLAEEALEVWRPETGPVWILPATLRWLAVGGSLDPVLRRIRADLSGPLPGLPLQALGALRSVDPSLLADEEDRVLATILALRGALRHGIRELVDLDSAFRITNPGAGP